MKITNIIVSLLVPFVAMAAVDAPANNCAAADVSALKARLLTATTRHLNLLLAADGSVASLKGKASDGEEALAFYRGFELTGDQRFRKAALTLADRVLKDMRAMKFGVLLIKEKDEFVRPRAEYDVTAEEPGSVLGASGGGGGSGEASGDGPVPSAAAAPFPSVVDLQLATLVDTPPAGNEWVAEVKYDGYRVALTLEGGRGWAFTRSHAEWSERFSGLTRAMTHLPADSAIIDGEAVVFDADGISRFGLLQKALGPHPERVAFSAFDLLYLNGYDLRELPLTQRKELLKTLLAEQPVTSPIRYADHVIGGGSEFYRHACLADLEGIVCKRADSRHAPGRAGRGALGGAGRRRQGGAEGVHLLGRAEDVERVAPRPAARADQRPVVDPAHVAAAHLEQPQRHRGAMAAGADDPERASRPGRDRASVGVAFDFEHGRTLVARSRRGLRLNNSGVVSINVVEA